MAKARPNLLRPKGSDDLGLNRALSDRLLPLLVASMAFLAALTCDGAIAAARLAAQWRSGAASLVTVQVPRPGASAASGSATRGDAVARLLGGLPAVQAKRLAPTEVSDLMRPWLGEDAGRLSVLLPPVFELRAPVPAELPARLEQVAPGTLLERNLVWFERMAALAGSLRAVAALVLLVVAFVAACVVGIATRAGLAARRDAIEIVHGLGGTDGMIAGRFAGRVTLLAFAGAALGVALAVPVLLGLARLGAPFQPGAPDRSTPLALFQVLPMALWMMLPGVPVLAAAIGWMTTQMTVRRWLGRLP